MRSGGIWATATEEDLAKIVVNTLMEAKEGYRKSPVLSSENLSLRNIKFRYLRAEPYSLYLKTTPEIKIE